MSSNEGGAEVNATWRSPFPGQALREKTFGVTLSSPAQPLRALDLVAEALDTINRGSLWRFDRRPMPPHGAPPDVLELAAVAGYQDQIGGGSIVLSAVAQPAIDQPLVGLTLLFEDRPAAVRAAWNEVGEQIVAITVMHVGGTIDRAAGYARDDPTGFWTWLSGAWHTAGQVQYSHASVALRR